MTSDSNRCTCRKHLLRVMCAFFDTAHESTYRNNFNHHKATVVIMKDKKYISDQCFFFSVGRAYMALSKARVEFLGEYGKMLFQKISTIDHTN